MVILSSIHVRFVRGTGTLLALYQNCKISKIALADPFFFFFFFLGGGGGGSVNDYARITYITSTIEVRSHLRSGTNIMQILILIVYNLTISLKQKVIFLTSNQYFYTDRFEEMITCQYCISVETI